MLQSNDAETISHPRSLTFGTAALPWHCCMQSKIIGTELPSRHFQPRVYGVGAWTDHLHFGYDLVALLQPKLVVELGVDRGESYFAFCQAVAETKLAARCFAVDTWRGDEHAGGYDETTFSQVSAHNRAHYEAFSKLLRCSFDAALERFPTGNIDILHLDGLHTEDAVQHDLDSWMPKIRPGGILLLHDVNVRSRDFGVWKIWEELRRSGRSWTFNDGPGLAVWQKPPVQTLPQFLEQLLAPPNESARILEEYYRGRAAVIHQKIAREWRDRAVRKQSFAQQTIIQVFYTTDGRHREEDSVNARIGHEGWKDVRILLPRDAGTSPLRIDFVSPLAIIEVASLRLTSDGVVRFQAANEKAFATIVCCGDGERLSDFSFLRLRITGMDPQLYLPAMESTPGEKLVLEMRLRVLPDQAALSEMSR
jgi:Methyltransferase domain